MPMDKRLYIAIKMGDKNVVEEYKEQFATQLTANKSTVLHVAAESMNFYWKDSTDFLAMVGWDMLFSLNSSGDTCIHLATRAGCRDAVKAIISYMNHHELPEKFRDIEAGNIQGASALLRMANKEGNTAFLAPRGNIDLVNADFSHPLNNVGKSALYIAAEKGNEDEVEYILNECSSPSYAGPYGTTALHAAVMSRSDSCVELLLKKNPSLTKQADNFGWNPLHYAASKWHSEAIVRKLLLADKEMAYETIKKHNMTPLHIAAIKGQLGVMKEIVEQCPDSLDAVTSQGQNVLHLAYSNKQLLDFLVKERTQWLFNYNFQSNIDFLEKLGIYRSQEMIDFLEEQGKWGSQEMIAFLEEQGKWGSQEMIGFLEELRWLYDFTNQRGADGNFPNRATREQTVLSHPLLKLKDFKERKTKLIGKMENEIKERKEKWEKELKERKEKRENEEKDHWKETSNTHLIVATLVLTVSFAAGFTIPGGFSNDGPNEGMAILGKKAAFKAFAITDTIAMIASSSAVFLHYLAALESKLEKKTIRYYAAALVLVAMIAMMIVFMTGLYVMLPSTSLAVFICVSCSLSIIFVIFILCKWLKDLVREWKRPVRLFLPNELNV